MGMVERNVYTNPELSGEPRERKRYKKVVAELTWILRCFSGRTYDTASACRENQRVSSGIVFWWVDGRYPTAGRRFSKCGSSQRRESLE